MAIRKYEGPIQLVTSARDLEQAIQAINGQQVVGLDTETKPAFRKGESYLPCLVQIATDSTAFLFQLKRVDFSDALADVLENPSVIKAGIGLADDLSDLNKVFPFEPRSILDLSLVAQRNGIRQSSVRNLAGQFLGFRITKGASTSNWTNSKLTKRQIDYAATDAWVCRELFLEFQQLGFLDSEGRSLEKAANRP